MASLTIQTKILHPAIYTSSFPPPTPTSAVTTPLENVPKYVVPPPRYNNAMLRASHAHMLRYMIAKLRWEQTNNAYLWGEKAWSIHNRIIADMEIELKACEEARKTLDRFPNVQAPMWYPEQHGPETKEEYEAKKRAEEKAIKMRNKKLDEHFPWLRQLFIGPKTKAQARNDRLLREQLMNNYFEDVETLLPSANLRILMEMEEGMRDGKVDGHKKTYEQERLEKEKARIALIGKLDDFAPANIVINTTAGPTAAPRKVLGGGRNERMTGHPQPYIGPLTKDEAQLQIQREERHIVINYLRQPWPEYNAAVANPLSRMARIALLKAEVERRHKKEDDAQNIKEENEKDGIDTKNIRVENDEYRKGQVEQSDDEKVDVDKALVHTQPSIPFA